MVFGHTSFVCCQLPSFVCANLPVLSVVTITSELQADAQRVFPTASRKITNHKSIRPLFFYCRCMHESLINALHSHAIKTSKQNETAHSLASWMQYSSLNTATTTMAPRTPGKAAAGTVDVVSRFMCQLNRWRWSLCAGDRCNLRWSTANLLLGLTSCMDLLTLYFRWRAKPKWNTSSTQH